jgi:hypothetical protein
MRLDLSERQLEALAGWARALTEQDKGEMVQSLIAELRALRERESNTRFLMGIEGDV